MATEVVMPKLGLTMEEGRIIDWLKKEGDHVVKGEAILEIETDKATVEVDAPISGLMGTLLYTAGTTLSIGEVIAYILDPGESPTQAVQAASPPQVEKRVKPASKTESMGPEPGTTSGRVMASPVARRVARELDVDLDKLKGTGPKGRIMEEDVRRAARRVERTETPAPPSPAPAGEVQPLDTIRSLTAERMVQSFTSAPHFYLSVEADASLLMEMRKGLIPAIEEQIGARPTVSDLLIKIVAQALEEHPEVNAIWESDGILSIAEVNVALAVATDRGLLAPVFHQANRMSLAGVADRRQSIVENARNGTLSLPDLEGGSFTLTNLGVYAVDQFNAIINPPQAAILAVGRIKERPLAVDGELVVRPTIFLSLSVDHRILDGVEAAQFLDRIVTLLESPYLITSLW